jgi:CHAD domain-containing protein
MKLTDDRNLRGLAARYTRRQVRQLTGQIEGIRAAEDIEFVHRARVALRRLRTALAIFAEVFGADRVKAWRKALRRTARDLGDARDKDVQIEYVRAMLAENRDPEAVLGIARVLVRWEKKRESLQPVVLRSLRRLLSARVLHEILDACKKLRPKEQGKRALASPAVYAHAQENILARFQELWSHRECLADPSDVQRHHAMRIAAKRLRYTMEIYRSAYGKRLEGVLDVMKQIQAYLGDLHDCDVWTAELGKVLDKEANRLAARYGHPGRLPRLEAGFRCLQEERSSRRRQVFDALVRYWRGLTEEGFWDELWEAVQPPAGPEPQGAGSTASPPAGETALPVSVAPASPPVGATGSQSASGDGRSPTQSAREEAPKPAAG